MAGGERCAHGFGADGALGQKPPPQGEHERKHRDLSAKAISPVAGSLTSPSLLMVARSSGSSWLYSTLIVRLAPSGRDRRVMAPIASLAWRVCLRACVCVRVCACVLGGVSGAPAGLSTPGPFGRK